MARTSWIFVALAGLTAAPCRAQDVDIMRYYPARAEQMAVEGTATMTCNVTAAGRLAGCVVVSETPPDFGFGDAALKMSPLFKMRPLTREGAAVEGGKVTIPIRFKLPEGVGPREPTGAESIPELVAAADAGDVSAENTLADKYTAGEGVDKNPETAFCWRHRAAEHGSTAAWLSVGISFGMGTGVKKDNVEAYKWFQLINTTPDGEKDPEVSQWAKEDADAIGRKLTPAQIAEAKARAQQWWKAAAARGPRKANQTYAPYPGDRPAC
jgi:TonB family protein